MAGYRVLLLDGIDPAGIDIIRATNVIEPIVHDKISPDQLLGLIGDVDGLIVRSGTAVDRELIQNAKRLRVVGRAGVGVDNVDLDAATEHGVLVMNSPGIDHHDRRAYRGNAICDGPQYSPGIQNAPEP